MDGLNARERAFVRAFVDNGGNAAAAARAAGYNGGDAGIRAYGSRLKRKPKVAAAIERELARLEADTPAPAAPPAAVGGARLVKGRGRGTATERVELAMSIARDKGIEPKVRIAALLAAAELEGERGRGRLDPPARRPAPQPASVPDDPTDAEAKKPGRPNLRIVMSEEDASGG